MFAMTGEVASKVIASIPFVVGIIACIIMWVSLNRRATSVSRTGSFRGSSRLTQLEQIDEPSEDDVLLITDTDKLQSKKITMAQLKEFIKS